MLNRCLILYKLIMQIIDKTSKLVEILKKHNYQIVTIESATCGLLASLFGNISGASSVYKAGLVTYSTFSKHKILKISWKKLNKYGTVSKEIAFAMVKNGCKICKTECGISITGVAGPNEWENKPIGLFYIGLKVNKQVIVKEIKLNNLSNRNEYRNKIASICIEEMINLLNSNISE